MNDPSDNVAFASLMRISHIYDAGLFCIESKQGDKWLFGNDVARNLVRYLTKHMSETECDYDE